MPDKNILHMLTPLKHMSPFDVNMAADAGYYTIATYTEVTFPEVTALVQDAIFSRPPKLGARTGVFIGGKDAIIALDMLEAAHKALVPPFALSLFADPAGSFTTAGAMVAVVQKLLREKTGKTFKDVRVAVFGATGVVGFSAAVIAALEGADVILVGYDGEERVRKAAGEIGKRFSVKVRYADGSTEEKKQAVLNEAQVALTAARAGMQVLSSAQVAKAGELLVVADVNAVPPAGVEGLKVQAAGEPIGDTKVLGVGPLTIGAVKYKTEFGLFKKMIEATKPVKFDFRDAFALATEHAG
ncbi:MAG: NAD(P)-dependent methylenetetrahydromethanopterin dehydrogenase [Parvibaculaceae bacterium]